MPATEACAHLPLQGIVDLLIQVCRALSYVHSRILRARGEPTISNDVASQLVKLGLSDLFGSVERAPVSIDPRLEAETVERAIVRVFAELALAERAVVYVNDLQWATEREIDTLLAIRRHLSRQHSSVALMGSYRDDETNGRPIQRWMALNDRHLRVAPLQLDDVAALLQSMLGVDDLPSAFVERIHANTQGSPYFVAEVLRALVEQELVYLREGKWAASTSIAELPIPSSIDETFRRRASRLSANELLVLRLVALHGGHALPLSILHEATSLRYEELTEHLATLRERGMARRVDGTMQVRPGHDRVRETVVAGIEPSQAHQLHRTLARAFTASSELPPTEALREACEHWLRADAHTLTTAEQGQVFEALEEAASEALATGLVETASRFLFAADRLIATAQGLSDELKERHHKQLLHTVIVTRAPGARETIAAVLSRLQTPLKRATLCAQALFTYSGLAEFKDALHFMQAGLLELGIRIDINQSAWNLARWFPKLLVAKHPKDSDPNLDPADPVSQMISDLCLRGVPQPHVVRISSPRRSHA